MSFIDHFRHPINSDEIRFITEEQQRLEQATLLYLLKRNT